MSAVINFEFKYNLNPVSISIPSFMEMSRILSNLYDLMTQKNLPSDVKVKN